ncbi:MAG: NADP-dependent phosphogluconate dehydrogenase [Chloroflexota bacterium]|nr:NADP-dependent phosphogluconate dehydrogenase [Chloroflexota bacterium]
MDSKAKFGVVGMGVMGSNLALNIARNGFPVAVVNRTDAKTKAFVEGPARDADVTATYTYAAFINALEKPRRIMLMVKAGPVVDYVIDDLRPFLEAGDILIDGGNSFFKDTARRAEALKEEGILYLGAGVSGGEEGALNGPSIMPGGDEDAWAEVSTIFEAAAAKAPDGEPCVAYLGPKGAGHYVKMVHNGIEYGDMQLIAEVYDLLRRGLGLSASELGELFAEWNEGELSSYLIEITSEVLKYVDPETGEPLVDLILDEAKQKGTGRWTSQDAFDLGVPIPTINAAVTSRIISGMKEERVTASEWLKGPEPRYTGDSQQLIDAAKEALYAAKIISYAQGFRLLQVASEEYEYGLNLKTIASIWRAGCIIRADLLDDIMRAFDRNPLQTNLLMDEHFREIVAVRQGAMRHAVTMGVKMGIPVYALSAALAYFDAFRTARLPANLTQAQRDYFGAHTYRRIDRDGSFHTEWVG